MNVPGAARRATTGDASASGSGLHFVFLQGMPSPFFSRIASQLRMRGCRTTGINLCFGDRLFWRGPDTVNYRGSFEQWPSFIADFFEAQGVTDLVLLGEQRLYHREAIALAQERGIRVSVTDFGYLRPDWITLERDGMTGNSRFPRDPAAIRGIASQAEPPGLARCYEDSAFRMALHDAAYHFGNLIAGWLHPRYRRTDRRPHTIVYTLCSARRMLLSRLRRKAMQARVDALIGSGGPFFVFPLQLSHDFQIVAYSPFEGMGDAIDFVIASFARCAPPRARLLVKLHPWDPGTEDLGAATAACASRHGIADRVVFVDSGDLDHMMSASSGVVTVNSTSGLRALQLGKPVKTLGRAVYDVAGLTSGASLDAFWAAPRVPDRTLVDALITAMTATIQIRGVFFREPGLSAAVDVAAERLHRGTVGERLDLRVAAVRTA